LGGYITEEAHFGIVLCRIDIPRADGTLETQYYAAAAIYALMPVSEELARAVAAQTQPMASQPRRPPAESAPPALPVRAEEGGPSYPQHPAGAGDDEHSPNRVEISSS
jgi:hypothetical protein